VKANQTDDGAAWVWEPQNIDYVAMDGSDYNPWEMLTYTSWNSGDMYLGEEVPYDFTPTYFNLTSYMSFTIQLPLGDNVIGYKGVSLPYGTVSALKAGDDSAYKAIEVRGRMWLGYYMTGFGPDATNLTRMYDDLTRTLEMEGPIDVDNYHHPSGELYHSAPWIEFNVANGTVFDGPPTADAGEDVTAMGGEPVLFGGWGSTDDFGIVNWTWRIWYDGGWVELYGPEPTFTFWLEGVYEVNLTVTDSMAQTDWDLMTVTVSGFIPEFGPLTFTLVALAVVGTIVFARSRLRRRED
jgi:PKD domain